MNRIPVVLFSDRASAQTAHQQLAQAGVDARINEHPPMAKLWLSARQGAGVRLEVPADQFEMAAGLLLGWDEGTLRQAIRCPECRSLTVNFPQYARHSLLTNLAMGLLSRLRIIDREYYCEDCHFTWPKAGHQARRDRSNLAPFYFIDGVEQSGREARPSASPVRPAEHREAA
jgi:hypothetical protein